MDCQLKAFLYGKQVSCTSEHVVALTRAEIFDFEDLRTVSDAQFDQLGVSIGVRNRINKQLPSMKVVANAKTGAIGGHKGARRKVEVGKMRSFMSYWTGAAASLPASPSPAAGGKMGSSMSESPHLPTPSAKPLPDAYLF